MRFSLVVVTAAAGAASAAAAAVAVVPAWATPSADAPSPFVVMSPATTSSMVPRPVASIQPVPTTRQAPLVTPAPLEVRLEPPPTQSNAARDAALVGALVGGLFGAGGALGAQVLNAMFEGRRRRNDRSVTYLQALVEAVDLLDAAYENDAAHSSVNPQDAARLSEARRKFGRAVELVQDESIRRKASSWQGKALRYALVRGESSESGPGPSDVLGAQTDLFAAIREKMVELG